MKKGQKQKKKFLSSTNHQLLTVKQTLDAILTEAEGLPPDVKNSLVTARDSAWQAFVAEQEKIHQSTH